MNDQSPHLNSPSSSRRLPFTGERCVPWADDVQIVYEHLHRYHFAAQLAVGRRVLDLGSGEGYGAAILAGQAAAVVGIEIDPATVEHSRATYRAPNLSFHEGSALDLGKLGDDTFDLVVCFEVVEHVTDQERLVREARRVLTQDGLFLVSTPNRDVYNTGRTEPNPFHVRELNEDELQELLSADFPHRAVWGQGLTVGSELVLHTATEDFATSLGDRVGVKGPDSGWAVSTAFPLVYLVCAASATTLPSLPSVSFLNDETLHLIRSYERVAAERLNELNESLERQEALAEQAVAIEQEVAGLNHEVAGLNQEVAGLNQELSLSQRRAREAEDCVAVMVTSRGWRLLERARTVRQHLRGLTARTPLPHSQRRAFRRLASVPASPSTRREHGHPDPASIRFTQVPSPHSQCAVPTFGSSSWAVAVRSQKPERRKWRWQHVLGRSHRISGYLTAR